MVLDYGQQVTNDPIPRAKVCDIAEQQIVEGGGYIVADLPVFNLTHLDNFHDQLKAFDEECTVSMFWVLDPFTELHDDWEFNKFRPNQWDEDTVHVFKNTHDEYRGARLYPKGTFTGEAFYQLAEIENNSFPNLKQIDITVTKPACYPTIKFGTGKDEVLMENFVSKIYDFKQQGHAFVWSVDTDVIADEQFVDNGYRNCTTKNKQSTAGNVLILHRISTQLWWFTFVIPLETIQINNRQD